MSEEEISVLIVEDNRLIAFQVSQELKSAGFKVTVANTGEGAIKLVKECDPDIILMDVNLDEERDGVEIMQVIHNENGFIPNIFLTGYSEEDLSSRINDPSKAVILEKPVDNDVLQKTIRTLAFGV